MKFRHELKYLLNAGDAELLKERLNIIMRKDTHVLNGQYHIRSLYFDDYWHSSYEDKMSGVNERKKYRIRLYNLDDSYMILECKIKSSAYICKLSAPLTRAETDSILVGDYAFLLHHRDPLCRQFYYECISRVMRPVVCVDYEREPYTLDSGNVRITFDKDIRAAYPSVDITGNMAFQHVLEPNKTVMEVKYTEFLPKVVQQLLPTKAAEYVAVSKFSLCYEKICYTMANQYKWN